MFEAGCLSVNASSLEKLMFLQNGRRLCTVLVTREELALPTALGPSAPSGQWDVHAQRREPGVASPHSDAKSQ